jgi:hypothetical protein
MLPWASEKKYNQRLVLTQEIIYFFLHNIFLIVHLTHSRPPPPVAGQLVAGRGIASCPSVAVNGGGTGESTGIAG